MLIAAILPLFLTNSVVPVYAVCALPEPDFNMSAAPDTLTIAIGESATSTISVTSLNGFVGTVDLSVTDTFELTGTLDTATVTLAPSGKGTATLTVAHDVFSPAGSYVVSVEGSSGALSDSVLVFVNVVGPDFSVGADPVFLTFPAGASGTSTVTVSSLNSFAGTVSLSTDVPPTPGLTVTLGTGTVDLVAGGSGAVTLTVASTSSTPPGSYPVSVTASSDAIVHSTGVFVTITGPGFIMSADPFVLEIPTGTSATSKITIESLFGFSGTIDLAAIPPPPLGMTAVLAPASVSLSSGGTATSTLTITVAPAFATPGFATIHVAGTSDSMFRSTSVFVIVPAPGIDVSANPESLAIDPGSSATPTITVTSLFGFAGLVDLTTSSSDPCLDVSLSLSTVTVPLDGSITSILSVTVDSATTPGTYFVYVDGTGGLFVFDSVTIPVTVGGVDTTPPIWPPESQLTSSAATQTAVTLSWTPATDDTGVDSYVILQDGIPTATIPGTTTTYTVSGLSPSTTYDFQVVAYDAADNAAAGPTATVTTASPTNNPPVLNPIGDKAVNEGLLLTFTGTANDPDGDSVSFTLQPGAPSGAAITSAGVFTWTPNESQGPGTYSLTVTVSDGSLSDSETITVTVDEVNVAPVLNPIGDKLVQESAALSFTATASDSDVPAQALSFAITAAAGNFPTGATMSPAGVFSWTPTADQGPGTYNARIVVSDGDLTDFEEIMITVIEPTPTNNPPVLNPIGGMTVDEGGQLSFTATATDPDGDTLSYSMTAAPAGATIGPTTGAFAWTPTEAQGPGSYPITIIVTDNGSPVMTDSETITVIVAEVNVAPVLGAIGDKSADEQALLTFTAIATDTDVPANTLAFSLDAGAPSGASINSASGVFTWTPSEAQGPGSYDITVRVSDGNVSDSETITVIVAEVNQAPVLGPVGDKTVRETSELAFTATATDADFPGQTRAFTLQPAATGIFPTGATMTSGGAFSWSPTAAQGPGMYTARIRVSDGTLEDYEDITITVSETPVNDPPVLDTIGDRTVNEGSPITFTATATDPDGDSLSFSLGPGTPGGASITTAGVFTWTPIEAQGPGTYSVAVIVSDGLSSDSETITISVGEVNAAPVLQPVADQSIQEGNPLSFQVLATDSDLPSNTLYFSLATGSPAGASITAGGVFTWTPSAAQGPGTYTVTVIVSDGTTTSTRTFTVAVTEPQRAPSAPTSFWQESWFYAVIAAIALAGIGAAWKLTRGKGKAA